MLKDLLKLNDEVFKMYQEMDIEKSKYLYSAITGFIDIQLKNERVKSIDIEKLLDFVKKHIEEQK